MKRDTASPESSSPQAAPNPPVLEGERAGASMNAGVLHGRLLQVSRLATIGEMAAGIAHELNQPLTAIANYAQACDRLLGRADSDIAEVREALREISAQAIRAADIRGGCEAWLARSRQSATRPT